MSESKENIQADVQRAPLPTDFLYREISNATDTRISQDALPQVQRTYDTIQDQIKVADTKAGALLVFNMALAGIVVGQYEKIIPLLSHSTFLSLFILFNVLLTTSSILGLLVFVSRFGGNTPSTKIFWGHIKDKYGFDYTKYCADICSMTPQEQILDYSKQITEVSDIANTKHKYARWGIIVAAISITFAAPLCGIFLYERHKEYKENQSAESVRPLYPEPTTEIKVDDNFLSIISILEGRLDISPSYPATEAVNSKFSFNFQQLSRLQDRVKYK